MHRALSPVIDPEHVRRVYNKRAPLYASDRKVRITDGMRARLLDRAVGDVLDLGVGAGATFPYYPKTITSLTGVDISEGMLAVAEDRARTLAFPVKLVRHDFQSLAFETDSFDVVVSSLALCGIPDVPRIVAEIR